MPAKVGERALEAADDGAGVDAPHVQRLEVDLNPPAVGRQVDAVNADERGQALDGGIAKDEGASACCRSTSASNDAVAGTSEMPTMTPVSWTGKNPFGTMTYSTTVAASAAMNTSSVSV